MINCIKYTKKVYIPVNNLLFLDFLRMLDNKTNLIINLVNEKSGSKKMTKESYLNSKEDVFFKNFDNCVIIDMVICTSENKDHIELLLDYLK